MGFGGATVARTALPVISSGRQVDTGIVPATALIAVAAIFGLRDVVKAGDVVKVKVMDVDEKRKRIASTMRLNDAAVLPNRNENTSIGAGRRPKTAGNPRQSLSSVPEAADGAMAAAFAKLNGRG